LLASPGFAPLPEMTTLFQPTFRNPVYLSLGQRNVFTLKKNIDIRFEAYIMAPYREILQDQNQSASWGPAFSKLNYAGAAFLIYQSPIGPVSISYAYYGKEEKPYSFFLNIGYILFNRESLK
jgi:NTE family protein